MILSSSDLDAVLELSSTYLNFSLKSFFFSFEIFYIRVVGLIYLGLSVNKLHDFKVSELSGYCIFLFRVLCY